MKKALIAVSFLLLPSLAAAAGFANGSLFLSKSSVMQGDTVLIHVVVSNEDTTKFDGSVVLTDAGTQVGTVPVTLAAGEAQTISVSWAPTAGDHTIKAQLIARDGTVVQEESQTFTIAAPPQPAAPAFANTNQSAAAVESSAAIQQDIANVSPQAASATRPIFTFIDGARNSAAQVIDQQIASTKNNLENTPAPGLVEGTSTMPSVPNPTNSFWFVLWTFYLYLLTIVSWIVDNAGVFYPVLAIIFFYLLWRLYKRMSRPAWQR